MLTRAVLRVNAGFYPAFSSRGAHLSRKRSAPFAQIDHRQHGEGAIGILGQAAVAHLGEAPQTLEDQKRMLDLGTYRRLPTVGRFVRLGQGAMTVGTPVGEVAGFRCYFLDLLLLPLAPVGAVTTLPTGLPSRTLGFTTQLRWVSWVSVPAKPP